MKLTLLLEWQLGTQLYVCLSTMLRMTEPRKLSASVTLLPTRYFKGWYATELVTCTANSPHLIPSFTSLISQSFARELKSSPHCTPILVHWIQLPASKNNQVQFVLEIRPRPPRIETNTGARAFHSCTASLCNNLPLSIILATSIATCRKCLERHLFYLAFPAEHALWPVNGMKLLSSMLLLNIASAVMLLSLATPGILVL